MPLPLIVTCFSKIQTGFAFPVPANLGSPGKRAVKRVCVCVCVTDDKSNNYLEVPDAHLAGETTGCKDVAAWRVKRDTPRRAWMTVQRVRTFACLHTCDADRVVTMRWRYPSATQQTIDTVRRHSTHPQLGNGMSVLCKYSIATYFGQQRKQMSGFLTKLE